MTTAAPRRVVLDASVVVDYLVEHKHTDEARQLITSVVNADDGALFAPDLVYAESASALRKLVRLRKLQPHQGEWATRQLARFPMFPTPTRFLIEDAWQLRKEITIYDACYVILARRLEAQLVTADAPLARRLRQAGDSVALLGDTD